MIKATYNSTTYKVDKKDTSRINVGNLAYSPFSGEIIAIDSEDDIEYVNDNYFKVKPLGGLERYPEFKKLVTKLSADICKEINAESSKIKSEMPYKAQFVLEEVIRNLEARV